MILDGVDVFVRVVQAGSFSAAARQLGMPTTTVSAKIARLEERLGATLLRRTTRRMSVTPAGEAYYARCVEAVAALAAGEEQLLAETAEPSGVLRITAPSDLAQTLLPPLVLHYAERYPRVSVELVVTNVSLNLIAEGVDLAVRAGPMRDSTLTSRRFVASSLGLYASAGYLERRGRPRRPDDLARHELLMHPRIAAMALELHAGEKRFTMPDSGRIRADDMQTLRGLAENGGGIALLPDASAARAGGQRLERVLPKYSTGTSSVYFVYPAQRFVPVNIRSFMELAIEEAKAMGLA